MAQPELKECTVGYLLRESSQGTQTLLGLRDSRRFSGIWNGPGGGREEGETIIDCLARELREEIGVEINKKSVRHFATAGFYHPNGDNWQLEWLVHFLTITDWTGEPRLVEGFSILEWFLLDRLPFRQMMADQVAWLPLALSNENGRLLQVKIFYGDRDARVIVKGDWEFVPKGGH